MQIVLVDLPGGRLRHAPGGRQLLCEQELPAALRAGVEPGHPAHDARRHCAECWVEWCEGHAARRVDGTRAQCRLLTERCVLQLLEFHRLLELQRRHDSVAPTFAKRCCPGRYL